MALLASLSSSEFESIYVFILNHIINTMENVQCCWSWDHPFYCSDKPLDSWVIMQSYILNQIVRAGTLYKSLFLDYRIARPGWAVAVLVG